MRLLAFFKFIRAELALSLLVVVSRLPFVTHYLYNWDASQYGLALERFDVAQHQPHPPGYILYVAWGKLAHFIFHDVNVAYVSVSIALTVGSVILAFHLARLLFGDRRSAFGLALLVVFNPYVWLYGEVTSVYVLDLFFSVLFALLAALAMTRDQPRWLFGLTGALAFGAGFRQSLVLLFAPLWLVAASWLWYRRRWRPRSLVLHAALFLAAVLSWLWPLVALTGGWQNFWTLNAEHFHAVAPTMVDLYGGFFGILRHNLSWVVTLTFEILNGLLLVAVALWILGRYVDPRLRQEQPLFRPVRYLFVAWLAPSYLLYTFGHLGHIGYLMTVALALLLLFGWPLAKLRFIAPRAWAVVITALVAAEVGTFLFHPGDWKNQTAPIFRSTTILSTPWPSFHNRAALRRNDRLFSEAFAAVRQFSPATTVLISERALRFQVNQAGATVRNENYWFRTLEYYLPDYRLLELSGTDLRVGETQHHAPVVYQYSNKVTLPADTETVVVIADGVDLALLQEGIAVPQRLASGDAIFVVDLRERNGFTLGSYRLLKKASPS